VCVCVRVLPVSPVRLSVEAVERLEPKPRREEVGLPADPRWLQRSSSMLLPLILLLTLTEKTEETIEMIGWDKQDNTFYKHIVFDCMLACLASLPFSAEM